MSSLQSGLDIDKQLCENGGMFGVAKRGSVMVKSCLINAFLCTVMTDGLSSHGEPAERGLGSGQP